MPRNTRGVYRAGSLGLSLLLVIVMFSFLWVDNPIGYSALGAGVAGTDDWPMFRHDLQHSGYSASTAPNTNQTLWNYTTGGYVYSSPAVVNGVIYVGSADHKVYALNAATGGFLWSCTTGELVYSSPAFVNGVVYVGSYDHQVYALNASTGAVVWNYTTGDIVASSPAVSNGVVYVGSADRNVYALNAATGAFLWNYTAGSYVDSSPAVDNDVVYVGSADHHVYALNASTGAFLWRYTTGDVVFSCPAVANGVVYVGSKDGKVYALNASNGNYLWSYTTGGVVWSCPAVVNGAVYVGSYDNKTYCLNAATGAFLWSYTTGDLVLSSPAVADDKVYVGSHDHKVYCLSATTGAYVWSFTAGSEVSSSPTVANGNVYVGSHDGKVYAFGSLPTPTFTLTANSTSCALSESVRLTGDLSLPKTGTVTLDWAINSSGFIYHRNETITNGVFTSDFPFSQTGTWQFRVIWPGDATSNPATSNIITVGVVAAVVDSTPPSITSVTQFPVKTNVSPQDPVKINATVTDDLSGVQQVTLNYTTGNGTWTAITMSMVEGEIWNSSIPTLSYGTNVTYIIMARDNAGNNVTTQALGFTYNYQVVPEFPMLPTALFIFTISTLLIAVLNKRKQHARKASKYPSTASRMFAKACLRFFRKFGKTQVKLKKRKREVWVFYA